MGRTGLTQVLVSRIRRLTSLGVACAVAIAISSISSAVSAHERFIKHTLKHPLDPQFFIQVKGQGFLGVNNNIWIVAINVFIVLAAFLVIWFVRQPLEEFVKYRLLRPVRGTPQRIVHLLACFLTDRPVKNGVWHTVGEWVVIMFMRSPGLVLMYSATNDSLVMPSYPLDPASAVIFKFAQVGLAILILTQTALPLCGAMIFGTWLYLHRWGSLVAIDATPVLSVAVIYITSPWKSHKLAITAINRRQMRWVRITLGIGFFCLGWLKIFNHNLTAGVADNFPAVMNDPLTRLLAFGTERERYPRETWIMAFAFAEVLSGFLLTAGVFSRVWTAIMSFMFIKLMVIDFGFEEIPHIYPIGGALAIMFSNHLSSEFDRIEAVEERYGRQGKAINQALTIIGASLAVAFVLIFPILYFISFFNRYGM